LGYGFVGKRPGLVAVALNAEEGSGHKFPSVKQAKVMEPR